MTMPPFHLIPPLFRKRRPPVGARPGTLMVSDRAQATRISVIRYNTSRLEHVGAVAPADVAGLRQPDSVLWVDVVGLGDETALRMLAEQLGLHPLLLEDLVNVPQRPKIEHYDDVTLLVTRVLQMEGSHVNGEQVSLVIGPQLVVTVHERDDNVFHPVRRRLENGQGPIRALGPDYLAYALLDTVVDSYYPILDELSAAMETVEAEVIESPRRENVSQIYLIRRDLLTIRRVVWPQREALREALREGDARFTPTVQVFLRDTYDHCVQIVDVVETYREMAAGLLDVYLSSESNRMNEIMKVLTMMASIFIPITFIAGVYGMNFENMPELRSPIAYPITLLVMGGVAAGLVWWFFRLGWIGTRQSPRGD